MQEELAVAEGGAPLSQVERVVDTFVAPSKTFMDVRRSASWWLPFILLCLCSYGLAFGIAQKVGWSQLVENTLSENPKSAERMANSSPEQAAATRKFMAYSFKVPFYVNPITNVIFIAIFALALWATINFGFGGKATFGQVFCVTTYAFLISCIKTLLAVVVLYTGKASESFTMDSMVGTSPGYYIDTPGVLKTLLTSFDVFTIWMMIVLGIGLAIVARTKRNSGLIAVFGWWILIVLLKVGYAAATS
ncbi:MAG: YIP1 family protein [Acidobacteriaceae bacterium]